MQYPLHFPGTKRKKFGRLKTIFIVLILIGISFGAGMYLSQKNAVIEELAKEEVAYVGEILDKYSGSKSETLSEDVDFRLFWDLWNILQKQYVDPEEINEKKMFYGAM